MASAHRQQSVQAFPLQGKDRRNLSHYVLTRHRITLFKPRRKNGSIQPQNGGNRPMEAAQPSPSPALGAGGKDISQTHAHSPRFVLCVGLRVTRQLTVLRVARNAVRFAVWNFVWTPLWSIATYITAPGAQDNEGDVQSAAVETTLRSLIQDVSDTPGPRCELAPPAEGK